MSDSSRRTQILDWIQNHFETMVKGTEEDDYKYQYSLVSRSTLANSPKGKALAMVVAAGQEDKSFKSHPKTQVRLQVILEIFYHRELNKEPTIVLEQLVQEAERRMMEDETLGGLAINCNVINVVTEADGRFDQYSEAALILDVLFQHHRSDPRRSV